jgi:hypothetical protein
MNWSRSDTLALAQQSCTQCYGLGLCPGPGDVATPCPCVFRAIFRACYARFRQCASKEKHLSRVSLEANPGGTRRTIFSLKNEEYVADFCLVSRRVLDDSEYTLFKFHYLLGADWSLCSRKLQTDQDNFFLAATRIEQKLGRAFRELQPHALFPLDEYFSDTGRQAASSHDPYIQTEGPPASRRICKFPLKGDAA